LFWQASLLDFLSGMKTDRICVFTQVGVFLMGVIEGDGGFVIGNKKAA